MCVCVSLRGARGLVLAVSAVCAQSCIGLALQPPSPTPQPPLSPRRLPAAPQELLRLMAQLQDRLAPLERQGAQQRQAKKD